MIHIERTVQCHRPASQSAGFTMLELMLSVSIMAILLAIGVPSFKYVTTANRASAEINALLGDMQFARAEAIREGQAITICSSNDGATCLISVAWNSGWIVFTGTAAAPPAPGAILKVQQKFSSSDTLTADQAVSSVTFGREGFAGTLPAPMVFRLQDSTLNGQYTRCLSATIVGGLSTQIGGKTTVEGTGC